MRSAVAFQPKHDVPCARPFAYDNEPLCLPEMEHRHHRFHWLAFVVPAGPDAYPFQTVCELWQWRNLAWRSTFSPGASFTAREMFSQGWRYCGPCVAPAAVIRS